jgi:hypothetical protein
MLQENRMDSPVGTVETANNAVTLVFYGSVDCETFADALKGFGRLLRQLSAETGDSTLQWPIAPLVHKGAKLSAYGIGTKEAIAAVRERCREIAESRSNGTPLDLSQPVETALREVLTVSSPAVQAIGFAIGDDTWVTSPRKLDASEETKPARKSKNRQRRKRKHVVDAITGPVNVISRGNGISIYVWDKVYCKNVRCTLEPAQEKSIEDAIKKAEEDAKRYWTKKAVVSGFLVRNKDGCPTSFSEIHQISVLE